MAGSYFSFLYTLTVSVWIFSYPWNRDCGSSIVKLCRSMICEIHSERQEQDVGDHWLPKSIRYIERTRWFTLLGATVLQLVSVLDGIRRVGSIILYSPKLFSSCLSRIREGEQVIAHSTFHIWFWAFALRIKFEVWSLIFKSLCLWWKCILPYS